MPEVVVPIPGLPAWRELILNNNRQVEIEALQSATPPPSITFIASSATAGADKVENLNPATGSGVFLVYKKMDANAHDIVITPDGTDNIDGVNAAKHITIQNDTLGLYDRAAGEWSVW